MIAECIIIIQTASFANVPDFGIRLLNPFCERKPEMAHASGLYDEIWSLILMLLVTSADGATDLARLSATSHKFRNLFLDLCGNAQVLKVLNFGKIASRNYEAHHQRKDLLCLCARAGNPAAESMLGKALLRNDAFFWSMIFNHELPVLAKNALSSGHLCVRDLVRRFISDASGADIASMRVPLSCYIITILGYDLDEASTFGILLAVSNMCCYYLEKYINLGYDVHESPLCGINKALVLLTPPSGGAHRAELLELYDEIPPGPL